MWMLLGFGALVLIALFWGYSDPLAQPSNKIVQADEMTKVNSVAQVTSTASGGTEDPCEITYILTRRDLFSMLSSGIVHNRLIQVVVLLSAISIEFIVFSAVGGDEILHLLVVSLAVLTVYFGLLAFALGLATVAVVFVYKYRGVLGPHVLQITERGLFERTEFYETLVRWPALMRIRASSRFLYIYYMSDFHFHAVPKRQFSTQQINEFEARLRAQHVKGAK